MRHAGKSNILPRLLRAFNNEGTGVTVEAVCMCPYPAMFCFLENKGECFENLVSTEPDELVSTNINVWLELLGITLTDTAVDAVAGDH